MKLGILHFHATFTLSGGPRRRFFERGLKPETLMHPFVLYGYTAELALYRMRRENFLYKGYFRQMKRGP